MGGGSPWHGKPPRGGERLAEKPRAVPPRTSRPGRYGAFLQRQHRDGLDQRIETDWLLHMELEPCPQNARAVLGTGEGRQGGGGCDSAALWWERPNLPDQPVAALPRHRKVAQEDVGAFALKRRSEEHTSELQSPCNLVCRLLLEKKNTS